ncbi:MAG: 30S ribosomal protein S7 [Acidimicrobiia bacterium]|nr:30S ribosomal protein S7 [Acidimicrobiia bacterium]
MPRKGPAPRRRLDADPIYHSVLVTQLVNKVLLEGKRTLAESIVYNALDMSQERTGQDPLTLLKKAVDNSRPHVEVKSRRVGGATYQVPVEVHPRRGTTLAIRHLVNYARQRREKSMAERLAGELMDASNGVGASVKRREDTHKMADANRAFAHYRW